MKFNDLKYNYRMKKENSLVKEEEDHSIKYAYVVFRSMEAMENVLNEYEIGITYRYYYMYFCCCCNREKQKRIK